MEAAEGRAALAVIESSGGWAIANMKLSKRLARLCIVGLAFGLAAVSDSGPTAEEYIGYTNGSAYLVPVGQLRIKGYRIQCGDRPTVIDDKLDDYGAAYPGFIILNTRLLDKLPLPVELWIYSHECGHQFRGPDEQTADCFGVQRGRREGWLDGDGLNQVCSFIGAAKADNMHFAGPHRCEYMRVCYQDPNVH
jgi:hypothetical protein